MGKSTGNSNKVPMRAVYFTVVPLTVLLLPGSITSDTEPYIHERNVDEVQPCTGSRPAPTSFNDNGSEVLFRLEVLTL